MLQVIAHEPVAQRFAFGAVEVDLARGVLRISGQPVECQPLAFRLLASLCAARGAVVSRDELVARLWPGQNVVSDESLTQVVHRLRQTLGEHGAAVRTVRKLGLRLDAVVTVQEEPEDGAFTAGAATAPVAAGARRRGLRWLAAALLLVATAVVIGALRPAPADRPLDDGYALSTRDLDGARPETIDLVTRSFAAEAAGNRSEAITLLQSATDSDAGSPVPPTLLAVLQHHEESASERSVALAESRLSPRATPYVRMLTQYARRRLNGTDADLAATASALLELRPSAWRLRLARAHYHLARRENAAALADLRQIPIHRLRSRNLALVLADRASLGDAAGAERDLEASGVDPEQPLALYVRGRIAWSRGDARLARTLFERGVAAGAAVEPDAAQENRIMAALMALALDDPDTAALFDRVSAHADGDTADVSLFEARVLSAVSVRASAGDAEFRRRMGLAADLVGDRRHLQAAWSLVALRFAVAPRWPLVELGNALDGPELLGVRELLLARAAFAERRADVARRYLSEASARGVDRSYFAEDAWLLAAELGDPPHRCKVDPPYPDSLRFLACRAIDRERLRHG